MHACRARTYSFGTAFFLVVVAAAFGGTIAAISTYVSITGQLPRPIAQVALRA